MLTLNRPDKLNAADLEMQERLLAELQAVAADPDARALILTGAGRAFSAGGDVKAMKSREGAFGGSGVAIDRAAYARAAAFWEANANWRG